MSDDTPLLSLPMILPAQAQKHVTHNEALRLLDIIVQLAVLDRTRSAAPATPAEGDRHLVAAGATGDWAGQSGKIAAFWGGIWVFLDPRPGWQVRVLAEDTTLVFANATWSPAFTTPETLPRLGIATSPDTTNRLAVASDATLFSHAGQGHQLKLNKASPADTASLLFQSNWSGHAELGLAGSDDFALKVSADGLSFHTALAVNRSTGDVTLPHNLTVEGLLGGNAVQSGRTDTTAGRALLTGAFGLGADTAPILATLDTATTASGLWRTTDPGTTGTWPAGVTTAAQRAGTLLIQRPDAAIIHQRWQQNDTGAVWMRRHTGTAWTGWQRAAAQITGTVAHTGGVPTGAVMQRGNIAAGEYVRFADGTQICTATVNLGVITTALGALFQGNPVTWTYPIAFSTAPVVTGLAQTHGAWLSAAAPATTNVSLRGLSATSLATAPIAHLIAIGRWF